MGQIFFGVSYTPLFCDYMTIFYFIPLLLLFGFCLFLLSFSYWWAIG
ncbi:hypothetical protein LEP1GSC079_5181 [Leptospira interrogans str. FPW1039]|uniref:Uncharacterized protein n=1 Tax=Leptospira interrogans str. FPW1039 TaxID=1193040 RepID=A0A0F6I7N6_LEPIR|nr:hypothetical protein LEP1GSC079_5181 [Leptospira interrogans str. FPW1039]